MYTESQIDFGIPDLERELIEAMSQDVLDHDLIDGIERMISQAYSNAAMKDYIYERAADNHEEIEQ